MVAILDSYKLSFQYKVDRWFPPPLGSWKYNTDGVFRENLGTSATTFNVKNIYGDLVFVKGLKISNITNLVLEVIGIREGLRYFWENNFSNIFLETY